MRNFQDRDPRFYRTFALPGFRWAYSGDATQFDPNNPASSTDYTLWNYVWYTDKNDQGNVESSESYAADNLLNRKSTVYVRKKSDDNDANSPLYNYSNTKGGPFFSAAPLIELRYAEVLLNFAEVACGAGHMDEAVEQLKKIRERVGYTGDCGLQANLTSDQAACMSAILYERQIEFAYEGKRFDDMRMWMLFDGGTQLPTGAPATWKLTGWGGNTCTWLGFKSFNGQRRENMEFRLNDSYGVGGKTFDSDPLYTTEVRQLAADEGITEKEVKAKYTYYQVVAKVRPKGVDLRKDLTSQLETLNKWYKTNLVRGLKKGDGYNSQHISEYIDFRPKYYLLGFPAGVSDAAKQLPQTIGWEDYNNGGAMGTFDPLAD